MIKTKKCFLQQAACRSPARGRFVLVVQAAHSCSALWQLLCSCKLLSANSYFCSQNIQCLILKLHDLSSLGSTPASYEISRLHLVSEPFPLEKKKHKTLFPISQSHSCDCATVKTNLTCYRSAYELCSIADVRHSPRVLKKKKKQKLPPGFCC